MQSPPRSAGTSHRKRREDWFCHCCGKRNAGGETACSVCGRDESYAQAGLPLPLHGNGGVIFRPSQVPNVLENLHETDSEGWTPLHSACINNNVPLALDLLRYGSLYDAPTLKGYTALHLCVYSGCDRVAEELVNVYKAEINAQTLHEKMTPLHIACQKGRLNLTQFLVQHGADVNAKTVIMRTPLHYAGEIGKFNFFFFC